MILLGLEMINHAITGYACFLSCQKLRSTFAEFLQTIYSKSQTKNTLSKPYTIEPSKRI
jgi:hypothetical protein